MSSAPISSSSSTPLTFCTPPRPAPVRPRTPGPLLSLRPSRSPPRSLVSARAQHRPHIPRDDDRRHTYTPLQGGGACLCIVHHRVVLSLDSGSQIESIQIEPTQEQPTLSSGDPSCWHETLLAPCPRMEGGPGLVLTVLACAGEWAGH